MTDRAKTESVAVCSARCVHADTVQQSIERLREATEYRRVAQTFGALADPTRASIVHLLVHAEMCTCDIAAALRISDAAVSQHLRLLKALRIVRHRRSGKYVYYTLDDAHVALLIQIGLTHQSDDTPASSTSDRRAGEPSTSP